MDKVVCTLEYVIKHKLTMDKVMCTLEYVCYSRFAGIPFMYRYTLYRTLFIKKLFRNHAI